MRNSIDENLSDHLSDLARNTQSQVVMIVPFITLKPFQHLVNLLGDEIPITIVTRWNYLDIISGVSDPRIFQDIFGRSNSKLLLLPSLHAKYYRFDSRFLVGSANITVPGIQLRGTGNVEILVENRVTSKAAEFEKAVLRMSSTATHQSFSDAMEIFKQRRITGSLESDHEDPRIEPGNWVPSLRYPDSLWAVYKGDIDAVSTRELSRAQLDLSICELPDGLTKSVFESSIRSALLQMPVIAEIDEYLSIPRRFGAVDNLISVRFAKAQIERSSSEAWQTTMRWLLHFCPTRYGRSVPRHSEVMFRHNNSDELQTESK
jgi:hypothetical protein